MFSYWCGEEKRSDKLRSHCLHVHNAEAKALEPHQKPKTPAYKNWKEFIASYPKVEPHRDPDMKIFRKPDRIHSINEHSSEIKDLNVLNRNEKKAMMPQEYALEQGTQVNFFLAGQHAMGMGGSEM